jgi:transcriptional regulator with GAF, ATPase, and Fis domain
MNIQTLRNIAVSVTCEHSVECVLSTIVGGLSNEPNVALARIWLIEDGDLCATCAMAEECADKSRCLHLVASAGGSRDDPAKRWDNVLGRFQRFPIGVRKVGRIAQTGEPELITDTDDVSRWTVDPEWAAAEGIRSFAGQPLTFRGEVLGVLAVFSRAELDSLALTILKSFADHAAAAIANARAFEEVERLHRQLEMENEYLREEVQGGYSVSGMVGHSSAFQKVLQQIELVSQTDSTALILGESGTGKELVARAIHEGSSRAGRPLIRVNCASIPHDLFESEFFGHVKGAFTGALRDRAGRFQLAEGGTIFLDEIGEIPLDLQGKLLRVLQEGQFERVGDDVTKAADVRVIAATNRNLKEEADAKRFRQDLFYRLSVFPIEMPPLRDRLEDVPDLAAHILDDVSRRLGKTDLKLRQADVLHLQNYTWPGNVRELQNVIERAAITAQGDRMVFDLPSGSATTPRAAAPAPSSDSPILRYDELRRLERDNLVKALDLTQWKVAGPGGAAELLGAKPTTLASKIKSMDITRT